MLETENIHLRFEDDAIEEIARISAEANEKMENIGARRLHTILEKLLDEISFTAPEMPGREVRIDAAYVKRASGRHSEGPGPVAVHPVENFDLASFATSLSLTLVATAQGERL